jgi:hypothetical protein
MSSVWHEIDGDAAAGGRTHALVIGTSFYRHLPKRGEPRPADRETFGLFQVTTPATAAFRFAEWLRDSYRNPAAPFGTVRLLVSPSDAEKQATPELAALDVPPATRGDVETALQEWRGACDGNPDNVAILYAAGHGIQISKDEGGIVLLEDFATFPNSELNHALHVGKVKQGMAGEQMAQSQFYFVDACEVRPEVLGRWQSLGDPIGLGAPVSGAPRCSAVYYSAAPDTTAFGDPGRGTLFGQALLDCMASQAVELDNAGSWAVTSTSLIHALATRVDELAAAHGQRQTAVAGGLLSRVTLHEPAEPPTVPLVISVEPEAAAACAFARLFDGMTDRTIFDRQAFTPRIEQSVPAGLWSLSVTIDPDTPPFRSRPAVAVFARPPGTATPVKVVDA